MGQRELALKIARCKDVATARADVSHSCHKLVNLQPNPDDYQLPEPWFGNLEGAEVLFIASNPSINPTIGPLAEVYPRANWSDTDIVEWVVRRVDQTWDEVPVTFRRPPHKDFVVRCENGDYRNDGTKPFSPQPSWNGVHKRAIELLGSNAAPDRNYALTEVVHCKSKAAAGVHEALSYCGGRWMDEIVKSAQNVRMIVLLGSHARNWAIDRFQLASSFAGPVDLGGRNVAVSSSFVATFHGYRSIPVCSLPHPTSQAKGGTLFQSRFGAEATVVLRDIAMGLIPAPSDTKALHQLLAG